MAILKAKIASARPTSWLLSNFENSGGGTVNADHSKAQNFLNFITSLHTGSESYYSGTLLTPGTTTASAPQIQFVIQDEEDFATGTLTFNSTVATNTFVINGVTFTGIASGATGNQFNIGADDDETAANAAAVINASVTALIPGYVFASALENVVTVSAAQPGITGNMVTLTGSANIVASVSRLAGGAADPNATTVTF